MRGLLIVLGPLITVLLWLALVALLLWEWTSWWAVLESYRLSTGYMSTELYESLR
jgi:hypothetical protein